MKKRWLSLYVENDVGVLAKVSGMFAGKNYNLESLTVGMTNDPTVSRMTIGLRSDDNNFEQIKKQLNRCVEVIKVIDLTKIPFHAKEIMFLALEECTKEEIAEAFRVAKVYPIAMIHYGTNHVLFECFQSEEENNDLIKIMNSKFHKVQIVRGGSVAIEKKVK
jgi:acetolactate synthase-1/3 small subunit